MFTPARFLDELNPADWGLSSYNYPPVVCGTASTPLTPAGTVHGARLYLPKAATVTNLELSVITAGATLTANQCLAALYDSGGALLSETGNQATAWASTGPKTMALTTAQSCQPGYYDVCFFYNGTTGPAFNRSAGSGTAAFQNGKLTGQAVRFFTADTGRTTTFPATLGTKTATSNNYWAGLS